MNTRLQTYLRKQKLSHRAFAKRAGITHLAPMVSLWARGKRRPGLEIAFRIEKATEGVIPASYWLSVDPTDSTPRKS